MEDEIREDVGEGGGGLAGVVNRGRQRWQGLEWSVCKGMKYQAEESGRKKDR